MAYVKSTFRWCADYRIQDTTAAIYDENIKYNGIIENFVNLKQKPFNHCLKYNQSRLEHDDLLLCSFVDKADSLFPMPIRASTNSSWGWSRGAPHWHSVARPLRSLQTPVELLWQMHPLSNARPDARLPPRLATVVWTSQELELRFNGLLKPDKESGYQKIHSLIFYQCSAASSPKW